MTQATTWPIPTPAPGDAVMDQLDDIHNALSTLHKGSSQPAYFNPVGGPELIGGLWIDDSGGATAWLLKMYKGSDTSVTLATVNSTAGTVTWTNAIAATALDTDGTLAANSDAKVASQKATKNYVDIGLATKPTALLDTDNTLAANSDTRVASQKATKSYVDTGLATKPTAALDTDTTLAANSDAKVASQKATKTYVDGAVASVTGGLSLTPGGRVTLSSGNPAPSSDLSAQATVYYTFVSHDKVPVFDGTIWRSQTYAELSLALDATSAHTGYHQSGKIFDLFYAFVSGTLYFGTGPAWTSETSRGAGAGTTELERLNGVWTNKNSMTLRFGSASGNTVTVPVHQGTYLGSFRTTADGQASDTATLRVLWNEYNRKRRKLLRRDTTDTWAYSTTGFRQAGGNSANQVDVLIGTDQGVVVDLSATASVVNSTSTARFVDVGIGLDSTSTNSSDTIGGLQQVAAAYISMTCRYCGMPGIGHHFLAWLESGGGTDTQTWGGDLGGTLIVNGLAGHCEM